MHRYAVVISQGTLVRRQFGYRVRLALLPAEVSTADGQAHAARTRWNLLHAWWQMMPNDKRTLANADAAIRQARKDLDFLTTPSVYDAFVANFGDVRTAAYPGTADNVAVCR